MTFSAEDKNRHMKEKYHAAKAAGLCPHCEAQPPYPGMVSCLACRKRHKRYNRLYAHRQREMRRQGLKKEPVYVRPK